MVEEPSAVASVGLWSGRPGPVFWEEDRNQSSAVPVSLHDRAWQPHLRPDSRKHNSAPLSGCSMALLHK